MNVYVTVDELKTFLKGGLEAGIEEDDDPIFKRFCIEASRAFDTYVSNGVYPKRRFYPYVDTKEYDHPDDVRRLGLNDDLLEVTTLTTENGAVTLTANDYVLAAGKGQYNHSPFRIVILREDAATTNFSYNGTKLKANEVTGIWGYHHDLGEIWEDSTDAVKDDPQVSASAAVITVEDAGGDDINGLPNRFMIQQLIRIEDEYLWITDVDTSDNKLFVRRGMNGTTAAIHLKDVQIDVFRPMDEIRHAITALAAYLYKRRDSIGTVDDRPLATAEGILVLSATLPDEIRRMLKPYRKERL